MALNIKKTKEMIVDFRKSGKSTLAPLTIGSKAVERVSEFKFLGVTVTEDLTWSTNITTAVGTAQQRLFYPRKLRSAKILQQHMINFYHCAEY